MTSTLGSAPPRPPARGRWSQAGSSEFGPGCSHPAGTPGRLDESARRLSHEEYAVAQLLASEGHDVRSLPESRGGGRTPDLSVCGSGVEVKSWLPALRPDGRAPISKSVRNKLLDANGQAAAVVLFARGTQLTAATVRRGLAQYAAHPHGSTVRSVRVLGDGFDLSWSRWTGVERSLRSSSSPRRAVSREGPPLGL